MKVRPILAPLAALLALGGPLPAQAGDADDGARAEIRKTADAVLEKFFEVRPRLRPEIRSAAGYAVFSTYSGTMWLGGSSGGKGVGLARATRDGREIFMRLAQAGPGAPETLERELLIVFPSQQAFDAFASRRRSEVLREHLGDAKVYAFGKGGVETGASLAGTSLWNDNALN